MQIEFLATPSPSDTAVSAARTCYFPNGIVKPEQSSEWARKPTLLESIFKGGHHTTLQHTHITMLISGVSRHLIWRLLHAHPFYNSEQVSQRYAKMKPENFVSPQDGNRDVWRQFYGECYRDYEKLTELLLPDIEALMPKFRRKDSKKKAQEMARYVLPQGVSTYLYHTVNIITLLRYIAVAPSLPEVAKEGRRFADIISAKLLKLDSALEPLIEHAKKGVATFPTHNLKSIKERGFVDSMHNVKVFDLYGFADFDVNGNYSDVLRFSQVMPDSGILGGFSTYMNLSLAADAQNQRHRKSPAVRPALKSYFKESYYTPPIIEKNPEALEIYRKRIRLMYIFFNVQQELIGFSEAIYALPNAHHIELVERNDFSSFHHKAQMRLCYNAQEEIFDITYEQVKQLRNMKIRGAEKFMPPCSVRSELGVRPVCPEGDHFCGVKVWKLKFRDFKRDI